MKTVEEVEPVLKVPFVDCDCVPGISEVTSYFNISTRVSTPVTHSWFRLWRICTMVSETEATEKDFHRDTNKWIHKKMNQAHRRLVNNCFKTLSAPTVS